MEYSHWTPSATPLSSGRRTVESRFETHPRHPPANHPCSTRRGARSAAVSGSPIFYGSGSRTGDAVKNEVLLGLAAKFPSGSESDMVYHPLLYHMLDVAAVAQRMWDGVVFASLRTRIAGGTGLGT